MRGIDASFFIRRSARRHADILGREAAGAALPAVGRGNALLDRPFEEAFVAHDPGPGVVKRLDGAAAIALGEQPIGDGVGLAPVPLQGADARARVRALVGWSPHGRKEGRFVAADDGFQASIQRVGR